MATNEIKLLLSANDQASAALKNVGTSLDGLKDAASQLLPVLGGIGAALGVREIIDTAVAWDSYKNALTAITGSSDAAQKELDYIWATAGKLGASVDALAQSWVGFLAASKGTVLEGEQARQVFEAVSNAAVKLGLSSDQTTGALQAIQQMMSKGKVSAEELRGQLGERLYGAFQLFAKGAGVGTAQLDEMLKAGEVGIDLLPKFANELNKIYATGDNSRSAQQALNEFSNSLTKFKLELAEAGVLDVFIKAMTALQEVMEDPRTIEAIRGLGDSMEGIISGSGPALIVAIEGIIKVFQALAIGGQVVVTALQLIGDVIAAVAAAAWLAAEGEFKKAWEVLQDDTPAKNFNANMVLLQKSTEGFWGAAEGTAEATEKAATSTRNYGKEVKDATSTVVIMADEQGKVATATDKTAEASKKAAQEQEKHRIEATKLAIELEKIASNERIKNMEFVVGLKTEQLKADVEVFKAIMGGIESTIKDTGTALYGEFGLFKDFLAGDGYEQNFIKEQIEKENERRDKALEDQHKLNQAQIDLIRERIRLMQSGEALINIKLEGLKPHLEAIMWEILEATQMRVNEDAAELLVGIGPPA